MRRSVISFGISVLVAASAAIAGGMAVSASSAPAVAAALPVTGVWRGAHSVPGMPALGRTVGDAVLDARPISCASAGNCATGGSGSPDAAGSTARAYVADEVNGTWGGAQMVPGLAALDVGELSSVTSISCTAPGDCTAVGLYASTHATPATSVVEARRTFVATESHGTWGQAAGIPVAAGDFTMDAPVVSCSTPGNCTVADTFTDSSGSVTHNFIVDEVGGSWQSPQEIQGTEPPGPYGMAYFDALSCAPAAAGYCTEAGVTYDPGTGSDLPWIADEAAGTWQAAHPVPGLASLPAADQTPIGGLSCTSAGNCDAVGAYSVRETGGTWGNARLIAVPAGVAAGSANLRFLSCTSPGNCTAAGGYQDSTMTDRVYVIGESNGTWGTPVAIPGFTTLDKGNFGGLRGLSCGAPGDCAVFGDYVSTSSQSGPIAMFLADEVNGTWGTAQEIPGTTPETDLTTLFLALGYSAISCPSATSCAIASTSRASGTTSWDGWVAEKVTTNATATTLSLSAPTVTYGHEQSERLTARVSAASGPRPGRST